MSCSLSCCERIDWTFYTSYSTLMKSVLKLMYRAEAHYEQDGGNNGILKLKES